MQQIVLLRGINLASRNRISMAELREALSGRGLRDIRTYLQSGNVVLSSDSPPERLARECERRVAKRFGLQIAIVVRTAEELAEVIRRNPLVGVAVDPKRYQVSFCSAKPSAAAIGKLRKLATAEERLVASGRELYAWHPDGVGRSKLAAQLAGERLGVSATARNWSTVTKLLELAEQSTGG